MSEDAKLLAQANELRQAFVEKIWPMTIKEHNRIVTDEKNGLADGIIITALLQLAVGAACAARGVSTSATWASEVVRKLNLVLHAELKDRLPPDRN